MAEDDWKTRIIQTLAESAPVLAFVVGVGFVVLGLAGGITHNNWLPINEEIPRLLSGALGVVLIVFGLYSASASGAKKLEAKKYGIKIQFPKPATRVDTVDVGGSIEKPLPKDYCLRVFRIYPGGPKETFVPLSTARIDMGTKTWVAERCSIGGSTNDRRAYAAVICGPDAEALISFHNLAVAAHRETMAEFQKLTGQQTRSLPPVSDRSSDMHECDRVSVIRS